MQRTFWFALVFALSALGLLGASAPADKSFEDLAKRFIEDYLPTNPESATQLGDHRFDDFLTDYSPAAIAKWVGKLKDYQKDLAAIDAKALTGPNRIDAQILATEIDSLIFALTEEKAFEWNPQSYSDSLANAVYSFVSREFAPAEQRLRSATRRMAEIPRVIEQIMDNLKKSPRIHMETAIQQTDGAINLLKTGLEPLLAQVPGLRTAQPPAGTPTLLYEFNKAQKEAIAALERYRGWLRLKLDDADGDFRIGAERFRKKLRYALDSNLSPEEILARAERDLVTTTETMYATARPLYEKYFPGADAAKLADRPAVIRAVLNKLAEKAPTDDTIVDRAREITAAATAFTREKALVTVPDTPLKIIVLPEFQRGVAVAYCEPPGALEPNGETFFKVSPTPATWTAQRKASFFREYNDYMLHDLCIHEATPGHYLQLAHSNKFKAPTLVRAIWWSGTFVEGWAVYSERFMADAGFGGPEVRMQQLKMRLRMLINAILDNKVHTAGMTEKEAMALMMQQGFQEEGEAAGKWRRACQSSTQLSTYFVGAIEHDDLRASAEAKAKREGKTLDLKAYHDRVLSFGSPPSKYVRAELGL
ncbi:MAG TPA: DUF885 domain-containing protein [Opitutaceae bacterium]